MRRRDRIVFVLGKYSVGGMELQLANLLAHRPDRARHFEIHTITLQATRSDVVARRYAEAGAIHTLVDRDRSAFVPFFIGLMRTMWRLRPAIVSTFLDSSPGAWGRLAAWLTRVPVIVQSDRLLATEGTRAHYLVRPFLDRVTDRFLPNAHAVADRLVKDGVPREKIRVMPNGVDLTIYDPRSVRDLRTQWGVSPTAKVLGYLGRFGPLKRVDLLLEAVLRLPVEDRPDYVVLAGDGATMPQIRSMVEADPWLRERCRILGTTDEGPRFLASIDYLVLPSESEGLPNVVIEAMAMGRPVIGTRVSDVPILIGDAGLVVPPGDVDALARAIARMQHMEPEARRALGASARQRVEREYDIVDAAARFWDAHLELVSSAGKANVPTERP